MTCESSTTQPALVYFPGGTYLVSAPIVAMYYSQLIGDPLNRPVIKASPNFKGIALVDSDPYNEFGDNWYVNQVSEFSANHDQLSTNWPEQFFPGCPKFRS